MITGFGNNTVSALASDITATQTTFSVIPGTGEKFGQLLTTDMQNSSSPHQIYAKLTLTDSQGTVFEICHLTNVSGDTLTVVRGQEGTAPKGWSLNDVVANFATRGSEECFVQIEQLQAGDYTSATAGGTPNGLTVSLPSTFFNNASSDWLLKTPLMVTPIAANSGPTTIQVTLAGKVIGTFPTYKGNKAELDAGDLLANIPFICVMDSTKTFFTVINPVRIYSKLGTAAFSDIQTSRDDTTAGRVLVNGGALAIRSFTAKGGAGGNATDANNLPSNSVSFVYSTANNSPGFESSVLDFSGLGGGYNVQFAASYSQPGLFKLRAKNGDNGSWNQWDSVYTTSNKPTASDIGAVPTAGGDVGYLNNSAHYRTKPGVWEGVGGFASQYSNPVAPFLVPVGYVAPSGTSQYNPITKAIIQTQTYGFAAAVSFGALTTGNNNFPLAAIHVIGDSGISQAWTFNPADGSFNCNGDVVTGKNIVAAGGLYESSGQVRAYSPNYRPQPSDINAIGRDTCNFAGFVGGDPQAPYMQNLNNNEVVRIARQDWTARNFISSVRLVGRTVVVDTGGRIDLPAGCVYTGMSGANYSPSNWGAYSAIQMWVNGGWVTVGSA